MTTEHFKRIKSGSFVIYTPGGVVYRVVSVSKVEDGQVRFTAVIEHGTPSDTVLQCLVDRQNCCAHEVAQDEDDIAMLILGGVT